MLLLLVMHIIDPLLGFGAGQAILKFLFLKYVRRLSTINRPIEEVDSLEVKGPMGVIYNFLPSICTIDRHSKVLQNIPKYFKVFQSIAIV